MGCGLWVIRKAASYARRRSELPITHYPSRLLHQLHPDRHLDVVAEDPAACVQRLIPVQAEILAIDLALGLKALTFTAPRIARASLKLGVEHDFFRRVANR